MNTEQTSKNIFMYKPSISLTTFDKDNKIICFPNNKSNNKAQIIKINKYRYAGIKPSNDYFIKLKELLKHYSHHELSNHFNQILREKIVGIKSKA